MLKTTLSLQPHRVSEAAMIASRQMWLASLGAAVVTRDWVQSEAGDMFKTLVKEGTVVESRAIRFVGDRIESSVSMANTAWKETRRTVDTAVSFAQQVLPKPLPKFELPLAPKSGKRTANPAKRAAARKVKRTAKAATKRATKATKRA